MHNHESRFVLLEHTIPPENGRNTHWDLMLEMGDSFLTWEMPVLLEPPLPGASLQVHRLPDHRLEYLDYEGEISGGRGWVQRIAKGQARWRNSEPGSRYRIQLESSDLVADVELVLINPAQPTTDPAWEIRFHSWVQR